jgi:AAA+ ATPase superfamily predicted ATPase
MFVGRTRELEALEEQYAGDSFEFAVIYGRRRVGKTALIVEFIRDKPAVFFTARETNLAENLALLSGSIQAPRFGAEKAPVYQSIDDALDRVFSAAEGKRLIFVIDEYPYLAGAWRGISSTLQEKIDHRSKKCKLFLILCGSSLSFMENQVLGYQSPLYGRRTAQYRIKPFDFFEAREFFPGINPQDSAAIYAMTGGIPSYLNRFTGRASLKEKVAANFLSPQGFLFEEPENLLKQELRDPANYNALIREIARGATRISEIASKTGMETGATSHFLDILIQLDIVEREMPVTEAAQGKTRSRKSLYTIKDNLFRFWYRFIPGIIDIIQHNSTEKAWEFIAEGFSAYMGRVFETMCRQYLWRENTANALPFFFQQEGRWWGHDPLRKMESEIDILAMQGTKAALFCECKWRNETSGRDILEALLQKAEHFRFDHKYYMLFSKSPFTAGCKKLAEERGNVRLLTFREM